MMLDLAPKANETKIAMPRKSPEQDRPHSASNSKSGRCRIAHARPIGSIRAPRRTKITAKTIPSDAKQPLRIPDFRPAMR